MTDDNGILTSIFVFGSPLCLLQCDDFISVMGQLVAVLDERSLVLIIYLPHSVVCLVWSMGLIN